MAQDTDPNNGGGPFDVNQVYTLGNAWSYFGDTLSDQIGAMQASFQGVHWTGLGATACYTAWDLIYAQVLSPLPGLCWHIGEEINAFGAQMAAAEKKEQQAEIAAAISEVLGTFLGGILGLAGELIGPMIQGLMKLIIAGLVNLIGKIGQIVIRAAGTFVLEAAFNTAIQLGSDAFTTWVGDAAEHLPLTLNWEAELIEAGVGIGLGGLGPVTALGKTGWDRIKPPANDLPDTVRMPQIETANLDEEISAGFDELPKDTAFTGLSSPDLFNPARELGAVGDIRPEGLTNAGRDTVADPTVLEAGRETIQPPRVAGNPPSTAASSAGAGHNADPLRPGDPTSVGEPGGTTAGAGGDDRPAAAPRGADTTPTTSRATDLGGGAGGGAADRIELSATASSRSGDVAGGGNAADRAEAPATSNRSTELGGGAGSDRVEVPATSNRSAELGGGGAGDRAEAATSAGQTRSESAGSQDGLGGAGERDAAGTPGTARADEIGEPVALRGGADSARGGEPVPVRGDSAATSRGGDAMSAHGDSAETASRGGDAAATRSDAAATRDDTAETASRTADAAASNSDSAAESRSGAGDAAAGENSARGADASAAADAGRPGKVSQASSTASSARQPGSATASHESDAAATSAGMRGDRGETAEDPMAAGSASAAGRGSDASSSAATSHAARDADPFDAGSVRAGARGASTDRPVALKQSAGRGGGRPEEAGSGRPASGGGGRGTGGRDGGGRGDEGSHNGGRDEGRDQGGNSSRPGNGNRDESRDPGGPGRRGDGSRGGGGPGRRHQGASPPRKLRRTAPPTSGPDVAAYRAAKAARWARAERELEDALSSRLDHAENLKTLHDDAANRVDRAVAERAARRSELGVDSGLSDAARERALTGLRGDLKRAYEGRFDPATGAGAERLGAFRDAVDALTRDLPHRLDREALWDQAEQAARGRFDRAYDSVPGTADRFGHDAASGHDPGLGHDAPLDAADRFGHNAGSAHDAASGHDLGLGHDAPLDADEAALRRDEAWSAFAARLRRLFDDTAERVGPAQFAATAGRRLGQVAHDAPGGIAGWLRREAELARAGRLARTGHDTGLSGSALDRLERGLRNRIGKDYDEVFGRPFDRPDAAAEARTGWHPENRDADAEWQRRIGRQDYAARELAARNALLDDRFGGRFDEAVHQHLGAGGVGRQLSDEGLAAVRSAFTRDVKAAFEKHYAHRLFDSPVAGQKWAARLDRLFEELPARLTHEAEFGRAVSAPMRAFDEAHAAWSRRADSGGGLSPEALARVRNGFAQDLRRGFDETHLPSEGRKPNTWVAGRMWRAEANRLTSGLGARFSREAGLVDSAEQAGRRFAALGAGRGLAGDELTRLAEDFQAAYLQRYAKIFGIAQRDVAAWLDAQRAAIAPDGAFPGGPHGKDAGITPRLPGDVPANGRVVGAAEQAAKAAERMPTPTDAQMATRLDELRTQWRAAGHGDAVVSDAIAAWREAVHIDFAERHGAYESTGLGDPARVWQQRFDSLSRRAEDWVTVRAVRNDVTSALDRATAELAADWDHPRFAAWEREQADAAGRHLAASVQAEFRGVESGLRLRTGDRALSADAVRADAAAALRRRFDEAADRAEHQPSNSPALPAAIRRLRDRTLSALEYTGRVWALEPAPRPPEPNADEIHAQAAAWEQAKSNLATRYAAQLDAAARIEQARPDPAAAYDEAVRALRESLPENERAGADPLPSDWEQFRTDFAEAYDRVWAPVVRAGADPDSALWQAAAERWTQQAAIQRTTLLSKLRINVLARDQLRQGIDAADAARQRWEQPGTSRADGETVDEALTGFQQDARALFAAAFGKLDPYGRIDPRGARAYAARYRELIDGLDQRLETVLEQHAAVDAARTDFNAAVRAWEEQHGRGIAAPRWARAIEDTDTGQGGVGAGIARLQQAFEGAAAAAAEARLGELRGQFIERARAAAGPEASDAAVREFAAGRAAVRDQLDLAGAFTDALPRLAGRVEAAVGRSGGELSADAAGRLAQSVTAEASAVYRRVAEARGILDNPITALNRHLATLASDTRALIRFETGLRGRLDAAVAESGGRITEQQAERLARQLLSEAGSLREKFTATGAENVAGADRGTRQEAFTRRLGALAAGVEDRLGFEAAADRIANAALVRAARVVREASDPAHPLSDDMLDRLREQHEKAFRGTVDRLVADLSAHRFAGRSAEIALDEARREADRLVDGLAARLRAERDLTGSLGEAAAAFRDLAADRNVPRPVRDATAAAFRADWAAARARTLRQQPLDLADWLRHEQNSADRFGAGTPGDPAPHPREAAPVVEMSREEHLALTVNTLLRKADGESWDLTWETIAPLDKVLAADTGDRMTVAVRADHIASLLLTGTRGRLPGGMLGRTPGSAGRPDDDFELRDLAGHSLPNFAGGSSAGGGTGAGSGGSRDPLAAGEAGTAGGRGGPGSSTNAGSGGSRDPLAAEEAGTAGGARTLADTGGTVDVRGDGGAPQEFEHEFEQAFELADLRAAAPGTPPAAIEHPTLDQPAIPRPATRDDASAAAWALSRRDGSSGDPLVNPAEFVEMRTTLAAIQPPRAQPAPVNADLVERPADTRATPVPGGSRSGSRLARSARRVLMLGTSRVRWGDLVDRNETPLVTPVPAPDASAPLHATGLAHTDMDAPEPSTAATAPPPATVPIDPAEPAEQAQVIKPPATETPATAPSPAPARINPPEPAEQALVIKPPAAETPATAPSPATAPIDPPEPAEQALAIKPPAAETPATAPSPATAPIDPPEPAEQALAIEPPAAETPTATPPPAPDPINPPEPTEQAQAIEPPAAEAPAAARLPLGGLRMGETVVAEGWPLRIGPTDGGPSAFFEALLGSATAQGMPGDLFRRGITDTGSLFHQAADAYRDMAAVHGPGLGMAHFDLEDWRDVLAAGLPHASLATLRQSNRIEAQGPVALDIRLRERAPALRAELLRRMPQLSGLVGDLPAALLHRLLPDVPLEPAGLIERRRLAQAEADLTTAQQRRIISLLLRRPRLEGEAFLAAVRREIARGGAQDAMSPESSTSTEATVLREAEQVRARGLSAVIEEMIRTGNARDTPLGRRLPALVARALDLPLVRVPLRGQDPAAVAVHPAPGRTPLYVAYDPVSHAFHRLEPVDPGAGPRPSGVDRLVRQTGLTGRGDVLAIYSQPAAEPLEVADVTSLSDTALAHRLVRATGAEPQVHARLLALQPEELSTLLTGVRTGRWPAPEAVTAEPAATSSTAAKPAPETRTPADTDDAAVAVTKNPAKGKQVDMAPVEKTKVPKADAETRPEEPKQPATPPRIEPPAERLSLGVIGAGDIVRRLGESPRDETSLVDSLADRVGERLGDAAWARMRPQLLTRLRLSALAPELSGLTRGDRLYVPVDIGTWRGDVVVGATLAAPESAGMLGNVEFENGSDTGSAAGMSYDDSSRMNIGLVAKVSTPYATPTVAGTVSRETNELISDLQTSRMFNRGKTTEPALVVGGEARFRFDFSRVREYDLRGEHPTGNTLDFPRPAAATGGGPSGRTAVLTARARATVLSAESEGQNAKAPKQSYRPPQRILDLRALGATDITTNVYALDTSGRPNPEGLAAAFRGPAVGGLPSVDRIGRELFGDGWAAVREELLRRLNFGRLHEQLKAMTAADPMEITLTTGVGKLSISAEVVSMRHTRNTKATEFNTGTDTTRAFQDAVSVSRFKQYSLGVTGAKKEENSGKASGNLWHARGNDAVSRRTLSILDATAVKAKVPGVGFAGEAELHFTFSDAGPERSGKGTGHLRLGFDALVEQAEAQPSAEPFPLVTDLRTVTVPGKVSGTDTNTAAAPATTTDATTAETPAATPVTDPPARPPRLLKPPVIPAGTDIRRPLGTTWTEGLPDLTSVLDIYLAGDMIGPREQPLRDALEAGGRERYPQDWADYEALVRAAFRRDLIAGSLVSMTRGSRLYGPALGRERNRFDVTARLLSLTFRRIVPEAELNKLGEISTFDQLRGYGWHTTAAQAQGGYQRSLHEEEPGSLNAGGGAQRRVRSGWLSGLGGKTVANVKYPEPMAVFSGSARLDLSFGALHYGMIRRSSPVRFLIAIPHSQTEAWQTTATRVQRFLPPKPAPTTAVPSAATPAPAGSSAKAELVHGGFSAAPATARMPAEALTKAPEPPFDRAGDNVRPPARITESGRLGFSDKVLSYLERPDLVAAIRAAVHGDFKADTWRRMEGEFATRFDPDVLLPLLPALTNGLTWRHTAYADVRSVTVELTASVDTSSLVPIQVIPKVEFESGTEQVTSAGLAGDRRRRVLGLGSGSIAGPHLQASATFAYGVDQHVSSTVEYAARGLAKSKTVDFALEMHGGLTFHLSIRSKALGQTTGTVVHDEPSRLRIAVPTRDTASTIPEENYRVESPRRPPQRIVDAERTGGSDITLRVGPVPGATATPSKFPIRPRARTPRGIARLWYRAGPSAAPAAAPPEPAIASVLDQLDEAGTAALRSGARWGLAKRQLAEQLDLLRLNHQIRSMMAGQPLVLRAAGATFSITASVADLDHVAAIKETEFNVGSTRAVGFSGTDGVLDQGGGRTRSLAVQVHGSVNPAHAGADVVIGGGVFVQGGHEDSAESGYVATLGEATKTKTAAGGYSGHALLHFAIKSDAYTPGGVARWTSAAVRKIAQDRRISAIEGRLADPELAAAARDELLAERTRVYRKLERTAQRLAGRGTAVAKVQYETLVEAADTVEAGSRDAARFLARNETTRVALETWRAAAEQARAAGLPPPAAPAAVTPAGNPSWKSATADLVRPPAPEPPHELRRPPASVWDGAFTVRDLGDTGGLAGMLDTVGRDFFGFQWDAVVRGGRAQNALHTTHGIRAQDALRHEVLLTQLPHLVAGGTLESPHFTTRRREGWVEVKAELVRLEYLRTADRSEDAPAVEHSDQSRLARHGFGAWAATVQTGAKIGTDKAVKVQVLGSAGAGRRARERGHAAHTGRVITNAKITLPTAIYRGHLQFTYTFRHGGRKLPVKALASVELSVPRDETELLTPVRTAPPSVSGAPEQVARAMAERWIRNDNTFFSPKDRNNKPLPKLPEPPRPKELPEIPEIPKIPKISEPARPTEPPEAPRPAASPEPPRPPALSRSAKRPALAAIEEEPPEPPRLTAKVDAFAGLGHGFETEPVPGSVVIPRSSGSALGAGDSARTAARTATALPRLPLTVVRTVQTFALRDLVPAGTLETLAAQRGQAADDAGAMTRFQHDADVAGRSAAEAIRRALAPADPHGYELTVNLDARPGDDGMHLVQIRVVQQAAHHLAHQLRVPDTDGELLLCPTRGPAGGGLS